MFVFLILYCGLRRGEALALTVNDIDMDNKKIYVNKNLIFKGNDSEIKLSPKTDAGIRSVPIVNNLTDILTEYIADKHDCIFTMKSEKTMSKSSFRKFRENYVKNKSICVAHKKVARRCCYSAYIQTRLCNKSI